MMVHYKPEVGVRKVYWRRDGWWEYINPETDDGTLYIPEVGVRKTVTELLTRYAELTLSIYPTNPPPLVPTFSTKGHGLKIYQKNRIGGDGQIYEMIILTFQSSRVSTYKYLMSMYFFTFSPFFYHLENVVSRNDLDCTLQHLPNL